VFSSHCIFKFHSLLHTWCAIEATVNLSNLTATVWDFVNVAHSPDRGSGFIFAPLEGTGLVLTLRERPTMVAPQLVVIPVITCGLTPGQIFLAHLSNAHVHMWGSVAVSSRQTYATGWNRWCEFAVVMGSSFDMRVIPSGVMAALEGLSWREAFVIAFLSYLRDGGDDHRVIEPSTVSNYLSGARFFLKNHNVDTSFVEGSEAIATVKRGMLLAFRAADGNKVADRVTLPFTLDLIGQCLTCVLSRYSLMDRFTAMAIKLGIGCLFRKGEYIKTKTADHHLRARDVWFGMELTPGSIAFVVAYLARDLAASSLREAWGIKFPLRFERLPQTSPSALPQTCLCSMRRPGR